MFACFGEGVDDENRGVARALDLVFFIKKTPSEPRLHHLLSGLNVWTVQFASDGRPRYSCVRAACLFLTKSCPAV